MIRRHAKHARAQIVRNPKILGGKPIIAGTRISVEFILDLLASGMTQREISTAYDLSSAMVRAAVQYATRDLRRSDVVAHA